jgi:hypothetical protein
LLPLITVVRYAIKTRSVGWLHLIDQLALILWGELMGSLENKGNVLGDVRAENDHAMLDAAFYDWQDYKILFEAEDRFLVVGRRGTGKSALTYKLMTEWKEKKTFVVGQHK